MKTVGIIGGLGPETTTKFYLEIVFACSRKSRQRPNILISNVAIPLDVEKEIIKEGKEASKILPFLISSAKQLEKGGADFIVIPCNTVHVFINKIRKSVRIPVLSIIEESSIFLKEKDVKNIGLFATKATIENDLFDINFEIEGIRIKTPQNQDQNRLGKIIHKLVINKSTLEDKDELVRIIKRLEVKNILLACTDLQLLKVEIKNVRIFDTLDILAKATVREMFKVGKKDLCLI